MKGSTGLEMGPEGQELAAEVKGGSVSSVSYVDVGCAVRGLSREWCICVDSDVEVGDASGLSWVVGVWISDSTPTAR
jgi:hypothetical protein